MWDWAELLRVIFNQFSEADIYHFNKNKYKERIGADQSSEEFF